MKKIIISFFAVMTLFAMAVPSRAQAVGSLPPDFEAKDIAGQTVKLSALKGQVVLLDFWATWCPPCRVEIPNLLEIFRKFKDKKFVIISVSLDRDLPLARKFVAEKEMNWVHIIDREAASEIAGKYQVEYIPSTFLINRAGKIEALQLRGTELGKKIAEMLK
jgi:peroxiredoxin